MNTYPHHIDWRVISKLALFQIIVIMVSNYLVSIPATFWDIKITYAAFTFPLVILMTDLTVRMIGQKHARRVIAVCYPFAVIGSIGILFATGAPESVALRIGLASSSAYLVGSLIDVAIFQKIRERWTAWWIAPLLSTLVSNTLDGYTFFSIAFVGSDDPYMATHWFEIATTEITTKIAISTVIFLPIYGVVLAALSKWFAKRQLSVA